MKNLWTITKNELTRYFISPLAYVYLIAFLILNGSFAIYFGDFFSRGNADLLAMFVYQPWLYLLFIPGISMRLWSEEFRTKTIIQIMTMPVSTTALVWGKFFASWIFTALALVLTFPFWITVNYLGSPDNTVIAVSYLGSFVLAGCMLAISQTMSALTKNQVIALVLAVIANLLFLLSGLEYVLSFFRLFAPLAIIDMIASFSFATHFATIMQGLVEARDIIFFTSIILLFNFTTVLIVSFKTAGTSQLLKSTSRNYYIFVFILLLLGFIGLNLLANNFTRNWQADFTAEKVFTLTDSTRKVLKELPEPVTVKLYYSQILGERSPDYRLMFDKIRILLRQYANIAGKNFDYAVYNPEPYSQEEDRAISRGLKAIPVVDNNQAAYFGLTINNALDEYTSIPFLALERSNLLEQDLTEAIYTLHHQKKNLGILSTIPVFDNVVDNVATDRWEIIRRLENLYNVSSVEKPDDINNKLDALIIIHPRDFSKEMIDTIRSYSYNGGKIMLFMDVAADASRIFSPANEELKASELGELEQDWGFNFHKDVVVADLGNSLTIDAALNKNDPNYTQDVIQFYINYNEINHDLPETKNLKKMLVSSASALSPRQNAPIFFIPMLTAGPVSQIISARWAQGGYDPNLILRNFRPDNQIKVIAARIVSSDVSRPFDIIAVADTDILYDNFWAASIPMSDGNLIIPIFDNANFVLNSLESLIGGDNLINLRGKSALERRFDKVESIRKIGQQQFKIKEQQILEKIEQTKNNLRDIWGKKTFEGRENFTPDELSIIANIRKNLDRMRIELRDIRLNMNQDIETIDARVKFINIYLIPLIILLGLMIYALLRRLRRPALTAAAPVHADRRIIILSLSALLLLAMGIASVYVTNHREIDTYEGKIFFPGLAEKINDVEKISLQSHNNTLNFYKQDGIWKLKGEDNLVVLQDRMRSFLSALIEARYYEKKSDKAEALSRFGLQPITVEGSPNIRVELLNAANKPLESFEVGKFDIEIGRGTRAAYIKFDNRFQVWLAAIELIDLSTDKEEWTFSRIWDLRFGRFLRYNHETNIDKIADLAKYLLNTTFIGNTKNLPDAKELFGINLEVEGNQKIKLLFLEKDNKYFVKYDFAAIAENEDLLKLFADRAEGVYYEISQSNLEKIKNVVEQKIPD